MLPMRVVPPRNSVILKVEQTAGWSGRPEKTKG
jgi:hypothetical protein